MNYLPGQFTTNAQGWRVRRQAQKAIRPALERFLDRIELREDASLDGTLCWLWTGHINGETGYGQMKDDYQRTVNAHAFSFTQFVGEVEEGFELTQACDRRTCCSPHHVFQIKRKLNRKRTKAYLTEKYCDLP